MLDLNSAISVIIGAAIPLSTQLVMFYVSNRDSNKNKKSVNIKLAINIVIKLTNFINDSYEYIKSEIISDNEQGWIRVHGVTPSFNLGDDETLNFLNKDLSFRISVIPTRIKYIESDMSLFYSNVFPDDFDYIKRSNNLYAELTIEAIEIRNQICDEYKLPKDKLFDLSDLYGRLQVS
ncbi:TPA: hypothetical protein U2I29_001551 [Providencia rettgeri]|nr:hypothetical protein [Providencia rettgeri]